MDVLRTQNQIIFSIKKRIKGCHLDNPCDEPAQRQARIRAKLETEEQGELRYEFWKRLRQPSLDMIEIAKAANRHVVLAADARRKTALIVDRHSLITQLRKCLFRRQFLLQPRRYRSLHARSAQGLGDGLVTYDTGWHWFHLIAAYLPARQRLTEVLRAVTIRFRDRFSTYA